MKPLVDDLYNSADTQPESHATRVVFTVVVILVGYHATLSELIGPPFHGRDAQIAGAFALAGTVAYAYRSAGTEVSIHDRQVDWIVGVPLLLLAIALNASAMDGPPSAYRAHRVDLFSLPIFVAGIVVLLFGLRALGRQRRAIAFLFLAWPWPYDFAGDHWFGNAAGAEMLTSFVVIGIAILAIADGFRTTWSALAGGAPREHEARSGHFRPPVRGAVCCAVLAAASMGWLTHIGAP